MDYKMQRKTMVETGAWAALVISIVMGVLYTFSMSHSDSFAIAMWGRSFLDCVHNLDIRNYASFAAENYLPVNYNISVIIIVAIWLIPVHIIELVLGYTVSIYFYIFWLDVLVTSLTFLSGFILYRILESYHIDRTAALWAVSFYFISGYVIHGTIGSGQIDVFGGICMMWAFLSYRQGRYVKMTIASSMILLVKEVGIIFYIPIFILVFFGDIKRLVRHVGIMITPLIIDRVLESTYFIDYHYYRTEINAQWNHMPKFFSGEIGDLPLFLTVYGVVIIVCIIKTWEKNVNDTDVVLFPLISYLAFLTFADWSTQWMIYGCFILVIACCLLPLKQEMSVMLTLMSLGYWIYTVFTFVNSNDNAMFQSGLVNFFANRNYMVNSAYAWLESNRPNIAPYVTHMGRAVIGGTSACILYRFAVGLKEKKKEDNDEIDGSYGTWLYLCFMIMMIMAVIYLVSIYYTMLSSPLL